MKTALFLTAITTTSALKLAKIASHLSQWQNQDKFSPLNDVIKLLKGLEQKLVTQREEEKKAYEEISCTELEQRNRAFKNLEYFGKQCQDLSSQAQTAKAKYDEEYALYERKKTAKDTAAGEVQTLNNHVKALNARDARETATLERNIRQLDVAINHLATLSANTNRKAITATKDQAGSAGSGTANAAIAGTQGSGGGGPAGGNSQIQALAQNLRKEAVEALRQNNDQIENERNAVSSELSNQQQEFDRAKTAADQAYQNYEIAKAAFDVADRDYKKMNADKIKTQKFFETLEETSRKRKAENDQRKKSQTAEIGAIKGAIEALSENKLAKREVSFLQKSMSHSNAYANAMGQVFAKLNDLGKTNEAVSKVLMLAQLNTEAPGDEKAQSAETLRTLLNTIDAVIAQKKQALKEDSSEATKAQNQLKAATDARDKASSEFQDASSRFDTETNKYLNAKSAEEEATRIAKEATADLKQSRKQCEAEQRRYSKDNEELTSGLAGIDKALGFLNKYYSEQLGNSEFGRTADMTATTNTASNSNSGGAGGDVTSARGMVVDQNLKGSYTGAGRFVLDSVQAIRDQTQTQIDEATKEHNDYQNECKITQFAGETADGAVDKKDGAEPASGSNAAASSLMGVIFSQTRTATEERGKKNAADAAATTAKGDMGTSKALLKTASKTLQTVKETFFTMEDFDKGQERRMNEIAGLNDAKKIVRAFMLNDERLK